VPTLADLVLPPRAGERRAADEAKAVSDATHALYERPRTRGDCADAPRPCPWVACKHHLYLDINPETGSIKIHFPGREPWEIEHTCALDVAEIGGLTLEDTGARLNLTRERIRQVEASGLASVRRAATRRCL
jgi:hypothetical protein